MLAAGCASVAAGTAPKPVPGEAVQVWQADDVDGRAESIFARNDSRDTLGVSFELSGCVNIHQTCNSYSPDVAVAPGATVRLTHVEPEDQTRRYQYHWHFRSHGPHREVTDTVRVTTTVRASQPLQAQMLHDVSEFVPDVAASDDNPRCVNYPGVLPNGRRMIGLAFGTGLVASRRVNVMIDSAGRPVQYNDSRGDLTISPGGDPTTPPAERRTTIVLALDQGMALLRNEGGSRVPQIFMAPIGNATTSATLGNPGAMIDRVLRECGPRH